MTVEDEKEYCVICGESEHIYRRIDIKPFDYNAYMADDDYKFEVVPVCEDCYEKLEEGERVEGWGGAFWALKNPGKVNEYLVPINKKVDPWRLG